MCFSISCVTGIFIGLFLLYCLVLFIQGLFKSNPLDYIKILDLEAKFKNKKYSDLNEKGETLLVRAITLGAESLALEIIKSEKVDIFKTTNDGASAFFYAVICGNMRIVSALIKKGEEIEPKKCGKFGSPLMWACRAGSNHIIDLFLERNANINRQTTKIKFTPLMGACFTLKENSIIHLLEKGADKTILNKEKKTALDVYLNSGGKSKKIIKLLKV